MSLRTRINGFTAWVNLRVSSSSGLLMHNVLVDLLKGHNMKILLESLTGRPFKKMRSFDGLTLVQKETRVDWMVEELKRHDVIPLDVEINSRMFAMKGADQVFELLWCLVCHDIWFIWERSEFLQQNDKTILLSKEFKWTPPRPRSAIPSYKTDTSLLSGFGSKSLVQTPTSDQDQQGKENELTVKKAVEIRDGDMINRKKMKGREYPEPDYCILDLINSHLQMTKEGCKLVRGVLCLDDLTDSRVLTALVNSFVPETFTTEVLLNDRWTVNLVLWTIAEMFRCSNPFEAEDLVEADIMSVCSYFAFFFMCGYRYRQAMAVMERLEQLRVLEASTNDDLRKFNDDLACAKIIKRKTELNNTIKKISYERSRLEEIFDVNECSAWTQHVSNIRIKTRSIVAQKIKEHYEVVTVPRNMTINELVASMMINLSLTAGTSFCNLNGKETITKDRKIVVRDIDTGEYFDDLKSDSKSKVTARSLLGIRKHDVVDIQQASYPQFEIYLDCGSKNKALKAGSKFLYQVFPGNSAQCQRLLYKSAKAGELDSVEKLVAFFENSYNFVNSRDHKSGNTALHVACKNGHFDVVQFLLESNADVNCLNIFGVTPFFLALEGLHRSIGQLLIEWGANIHKKNRSGKTALDLLRHAELKEFFKAKGAEMATVLPQIIAGDTNVLLNVIKSHHSGTKKFASLRSRCLNGSTLIHTASYFGSIDAIKILLAQKVDVNLLDYRGATPLHRVKDVATMELLLDAGADISILDEDKNSALHVKCYGENEESTQIECIKKLIEKRISLVSRNKRELMPIHCCAMQGRIDGIQTLLDADIDSQIRQDLEKEQELPPSLAHLAIANDHFETAQWLLQNLFQFKQGEPDILLEKLLRDKIPCSDFTSTTELLVHAGASTNILYSQGNTPLHLAAAQKHMTEVLHLLIQKEANVNAFNEDRLTPLFYATKNNNLYGAKILLQNGADVRLRNYQGLSAFDLISEYDEWIESECFDEDVVARLKAYNLKQSRDLVRAITKKVQRAEKLPCQRLQHDPAAQSPKPLQALLPPLKK